jgi:hypothetical protein
MHSDELERSVETLRSEPVGIGPGFDARVMAAIRPSPRWRLRTAKAWWLRPRPVPVSPFGALLGLAAAAATLALVLRPAPVALDRPAVVARFVLAAPGASRVDLVGDFNGWSAGATPLRPVGGTGVWTVEVPLVPGAHEYAFVVDGREWRADPAAPRASRDDYGQPNSVITVGAHRS